MPSLDDLNSILTWYQNYVGTFDKGKWEQSIEERILHGINSIPKKSAKVQSELIDLDLVRGSSFSKPKPKHGIFATTRLAILRFVFLPLFHKWWSAQTSQHLFLAFLCLYGLQVFNVFLYLNSGFGVAATNHTSSSVNLNHVPIESAAGGSAGTSEPTATTGNAAGIQTSEIITPIILMIALTILHSQIVATHTSGDLKKKENVERLGSASGQRRRGSITGLKNRKRRNTGRLPPFRRRSSTIGSATANASGGNASTSNSPARTLQINSTTTTRRTSCVSSANNLNKVITTTTCMKKVIFEDESKSLSSNSDKDEGIAEEIVSNEDDSVFVRTVREPSPGEEGLSRNETALSVSTMSVGSESESLVGESFDSSNTCTDQRVPVEAELKAKKLPLRSNLRTRNPSKQSEASTTSGGDLSSNNNETSSDEAEDEQVDEDEETRTKSEWTAVTTNSDDDDYGDEINNSDDEDQDEDAYGPQDYHDHPFNWELQEHTHFKYLNMSGGLSDKVSCTIWEGHEAKKVDLGVLEISSMIIAKVDCARENSDYLNLGMFFSCLLGVLPACWRVNSQMDIHDFHLSTAGQYLADGISVAFGETYLMRLMILISIVEKLFLSLCVFFLLAVAEKTYKQRFLFAKLFSRITSCRKARKSGIPHFRLNKVRNIKTWLSVRSYLQRRGPQRSVDIVVSATFIATFILIFFFSVELLKDSNRMYYLYNVEVMAWAMTLGIFLMRYMTLGSRVSQKYRNLSVIITEQLNLYLKMEQKPHKKDELLVANNVLKLASDLLKELEDPFKISSFASNPYLYNVTRIVILSAFSGVLSEMLGFKLKLYNIKIS